ncbi:MAG: hypothetical protein WAS21_10425 [Geminicoccaceae bacterium]
MMVRAKFRCTEIKRVASAVPDGSGGWKDGEAQAVQLQQNQLHGDQELASNGYVLSVQSGTISVEFVDPADAQEFQLNGEYYVDFSAAPAA